MDVEKAIEVRRAYRSFVKTEITKELIEELAKAAQSAPSCNNNQPWHYVFAYDPAKLEEMKPVFNKGNSWCWGASMIIAAFSNAAADCVINERIYDMFDLGLGTGLMLLRATELGLVAHPIAGYDEALAKKILNIPENMQIITLILVGKHGSSTEGLSDKQKLAEQGRPPRKAIKDFVWHNSYKEEQIT